MTLLKSGAGFKNVDYSICTSYPETPDNWTRK